MTRKMAPLNLLYDIFYGFESNFGESKAIFSEFSICTGFDSANLPLNGPSGKTIWDRSFFKAAYESWFKILASRPFRNPIRSNIDPTVQKMQKNRAIFIFKIRKNAITSQDVRLGFWNFVFFTCRCIQTINILWLMLELFFFFDHNSGHMCHWTFYTG